MSGCAHNHTFDNKLGEWLKHDIQKMGSLVFIAGEVDNHYRVEAAAQWFTKELEAIDKIFEKVYIISKKTPAYLARKWVNTADMIVMLGGNPIEQKAMCRKFKIWRLLRDFDGIMLGISAGAMCMSEYVIDASDNAGPFLLLQDIHEDSDGRDVCHHSFVRATDFEARVHCEHNSKAWIADGWKVELLKYE